MTEHRPLVMVGGVGQLYQGDLDVGRRVAEHLARERLAGDLVDAVVEDLHYGAVAVTQRLEDVRPDVLVLVGAEQRGRPPGTVERRVVAAPKRPSEVAAAYVADAVAGHVTLDHVIEVAAALGALPPRTIVIEIEPASTAPSVELSAELRAAFDHLLELIRRDVRRVGLSAPT